MKNYIELLNIEDVQTKKSNFAEDRGEVSFYCKDCKKLVETTREKPESYVFICNECNGKEIVIGTKEGLRENYRLG